MKHKIRTFFVHPTADFYPIMYGVLILLWGVWLLLPFSTFHSVSTFAVLAKIGPEWVWGTLAVAIGAIQILLIMVSRKLERTAALLQFYFWAFIAITIGLSNWHGSGLIIYSWLAVMNGLAWVNRSVRDE